MRPRARNPRRTTRAEPARNADAHNVRNPSVLLILVVVVVGGVVVVGVAVAVAAAAGVVVVIIISYSSPISACQTKPTHAKRLVALLDGGEQSNSESNKATSTRKPLFSKLFAL